MTIAATAVIALILGVCLGTGFGRGDMRRYGHDRGMESGRMMMDRDMHRMYGTASSTMDGMMRGMMAGMEGKTGDEFDKAFLMEMIMHHQGAVVMAEAALRDAKHQEIKDLAKAIIDAQKKEIADMQAWNQAWYAR